MEATAVDDVAEQDEALAERDQFKYKWTIQRRKLLEGPRALSGSAMGRERATTRTYAIEADKLDRPDEGALLRYAEDLNKKCEDAAKGGILTMSQAELDTLAEEIKTNKMTVPTKAKVLFVQRALQDWTTSSMGFLDSFPEMIEHHRLLAR